MNDWKQKLKLRLPVILLLAVTLLFWGFYDRYERVGPVLLEAPSVGDATYLRGDSTETNGLFTLARSVSAKSASIHFRMAGAADYSLIRVHGRIKVKDVIQGKHPWNCARLLLVQRDENNKWISGPHNVVSKRGSKDWSFHEEVFEINPQAAHVDLVMEQIGSSGTAVFDRLMVEPVRIRPSFVWWRIVFSCFWIFMAALYFRRCRLHQRKLKLLILLNALAILAGTLMPSVWIKNSVEQAKAALEKTLEKPVQLKAVPSQKKIVAPKMNRTEARIEQFNEVVGGAHHIGHFGLFAALCFLVYCSAALERQHPIYFLKVGFDVLLFAAITEALQHLTLDRTAGILDLRTDLYGMATALVLFLVVRPLLLKRR